MTKVTQAHIDARTKEILDAAMMMFAHKGVDDTTMQEIAAKAGLSAGAIYRYYPSKEDLLRAVFAYCTQRNGEVFDLEAASTDSPLEVIIGVGRTAWDTLRGEEGRQDTILGLETTLAAARQPEELGADHREMGIAVIGTIARLVREAQAAGEIDLGVDARALAVTLLACHLGSGLLALQLGDDADTDAVFDVVTDMVRRLAPRAS